MKKITLLLVCLLVGVATSFAQRAGDSSVGLNFNYASETEFGIGTKYQYYITDNVRMEPEFNYFFKHDYVSFWDLGLNVSYLFQVAPDVGLYPLVGLGYANAHFDEWDSNDGSVQAKFGAGAEFRVYPNCKLIIEPKYQVLNTDFKNQFVITAGLSYTF